MSARVLPLIIHGKGGRTRRNVLPTDENIEALAIPRWSGPEFTVLRHGGPPEDKIFGTT